MRPVEGVYGSTRQCKQLAKRDRSLDVTFGALLLVMGYEDFTVVV